MQYIIIGSIFCLSDILIVWSACIVAGRVDHLMGLK